MLFIAIRVGGFRLLHQTAHLEQSMPRQNSRRRPRYVRKLDRVPEIPAEEVARLQPVTSKYVFRANDYYLKLIDWNDPEDPIRQLIIPREDELKEWGRLDASNETAVTVARGVQHKYVDTVLLLCNEVCGAYCRYCFRKRLFMDDNDEVTNDVSAGLKYIRSASGSDQRTADRRGSTADEHTAASGDLLKRCARFRTSASFASARRCQHSTPGECCATRICRRPSESTRLQRSAFI